VPIFEVALKNTLSDAVGTEALIVAAIQVCETTVPLVDVVHVFTLPLTIVPRIVPDAKYTVMPATSAGEPTVVNVLPERLAVKDKGRVDDQFTVFVLLQVPVPFTQ
jgi:hypothetical protein